jgi:hypothetical protein
VTQPSLTPETWLQISNLENVDAGRGSAAMAGMIIGAPPAFDDVMASVSALEN